MLSRLFIAALWSPAGLLALVGDVYCIFVTFPCYPVRGIVRPANRDWACQTKDCHTLSNKTILYSKSGESCLT